MPIAVVINGEVFAVHSDHLNTPRRLTNSQGQAVRQWAYSAFGDEKPTLAKYRFANLEVNPNPGTTGIAEVVLNKRYDGQYFDEESGLNYNGFQATGQPPADSRNPIGSDSMEGGTVSETHFRTRFNTLIRRVWRLSVNW
ncbi:hypothetical protein [Variovorax sp. KK3]|uniref:hypothetical protein n=2 Tax=Variovorax sp. KK3 TaxID=1855728 RepID=UPI003AAFA7DD